VLTLLSTVLAMLGPVKPAVASVGFFDGVFPDIQWQLNAYYTLGNGGTTSALQVLTGGNPAEYRQITDTVNDAGNYPNSAIAGFHQYMPGSYDPASQGAIYAIDYSEDSIDLSNNGGQGQGAAVAIEQAGIVYVGPIFITPERTWTHHSYPGLGQNSFVNWPDTQHPDFSTSGATIYVGFWRQNSTYSGGYTVVGGIDNWSFVINAQPSPVEKTSWGRIKALYSSSMSR
jgi:hypothetical protein